MFTIKIRLFLIFACVALFQGCATLPSSEQMKAETAGFQLPKQPSSGKALVYFVRPSGIGALVRFNVFVDSQSDEAEVGYTRGGPYIYFGIDPGTRKISSKAENWAEWTIKVNAGDVIYLQQELLLLEDLLQTYLPQLRTLAELIVIYLQPVPLLLEVIP